MDTLDSNKGSVPKTDQKTGQHVLIDMCTSKAALAGAEPFRKDSAYAGAFSHRTRTVRSTQINIQRFVRNAHLVADVASLFPTTAQLYHMQKDLIKWRRARAARARRLVPERAEARWEQTTPLWTLSVPSPEGMQPKREFAALANRIRHSCRKRFAALRCSRFD